jgi:DNA-binding NarL/FixJ family response regulator
VLAALLSLFTSVWKASTPLGAPRRRDDNGLSKQDKQVLAMLGRGLTDETIARRLGVSVRTARRVASDLLARLDARSRFQAGARAVARRWLTEDDLE